jgi:hypothetical protein
MKVIEREKNRGDIELPEEPTEEDREGRLHTHMKERRRRRTQRHRGTLETFYVHWGKPPRFPSRRPRPSELTPHSRDQRAAA